MGTPRTCRSEALAACDNSSCRQTVQNGPFDPVSSQSRHDQGKTNASAARPNGADEPCKTLHALTNPANCPRGVFIDMSKDSIKKTPPCRADRSSGRARAVHEVGFWPGPEVT